MLSWHHLSIDVIIVAEPLLPGLLLESIVVCHPFHSYLLVPTRSSVRCHPAAHPVARPEPTSLTQAVKAPCHARAVLSTEFPQH